MVEVTEKMVDAAIKANTAAKLFGGEPRDWVRAALEAALASPAEVVEPVAYQYRFSAEDQWRPFPPIFSDIEHEKRPLYLHPPQQEPARLREEIARLGIDASNHAADAETVRRERDALLRENESLRDSLAKCRTSYCGYSLSGSYDEAAEVVSRFYAELSRIDQFARSAISGTPIALTFANEPEHKRNSPFVPVPKTGTVVHPGPEQEETAAIRALSQKKEG